MREQKATRSWTLSVVLSLAIHGLLFAGLITVFRWQTSAEYVFAELWAPEDVTAGLTPEGVAQKAPEPEKVEPEPPKPDVKAPEEEPQKAPEPEPAPEVKKEAAPDKAAEAAAAQALEERQAADARRAQEARLAQERAEAERIEAQRRAERIEAEKRRQEELKKEEERLAQEKLAQEKRKAEEARKAQEAAKKAEEAKKAAARKKAEEAAKKAAAIKKAREERLERERLAKSIRDQELARLNARFDPEGKRSGLTTGDKRQVLRTLSGTALARYHALVAACIRPNITYEVPSGTQRGQYVAIYDVKLDPAQRLYGSPTLVKSSGLPAYDSAVERAIRRCDPFPQPEVGYEAPRELTLTFDPIDDKR